jgi:hypothetical protein
MPRITLALATLLIAAPLSAEWVAGYEGDDRRGYGYLMRLERFPIAPGRQVVVWGTASYLFYDAREAGGASRVTSPGVGAGAMVRWSTARSDFGIGPGYEVRWTRRADLGGFESREIEHGPSVQGDLSYRLDALTRLGVAGSYSDANEWLHGRGHLIREISPALRAGPEAGVQGNDDVRVYSYGGVVEVPLQDRTGLQFRAGQSRIRYRDGTEEARPYYSLGIARSF